MNEPTSSSEPAAENPSTNSPEPATPTPPPAEPAAPVVPSKPRRRGLKWLVVVLFLVIIGAGLYLVYHYGQTTKTATTSAPVKKDIALLTIGEGEPLPTTYYPNIDDSGINADVSGQAFEGLTRFTDKTKVVPNLALSWSNPDTSTWIFKLRPNVLFHTGKTMTADDVKASLDNIQNFPYGSDYATSIKQVTVVDPLTVKIATDGPDPILPNQLALLWIYDTTSKTPNSPLNGTGPYTSSSATVPAGNIELTAFDQYWGGRPHVRSVRFIGLSGNDTLTQQAITQQQYDIIDAHTDNNVTLGKQHGYQYLDILQPLVAHLMLNSQKAGSPLSKLAVRNALMQALDIPTLLKVRNLTGEPATQIVPPQIPGYDPSITRPAYDPSAARAAIVAAGYPKGFSIKFTYFSSVQPLADEVKKEFAAVGVTVVEDPQVDLSTLASVAFGGKTDMYFVTMNSSLVDATDVFNEDMIRSKNFDDPQLDALSDQAQATLDPAKRLSILQQMSRLVVQDRADLPLYSTPDSNWLIKPNIYVTQYGYNSELCVRLFDVYGT